MIAVDGKEIARKIVSETSEIVSTLTSSPKLGIVTCAPNFETRKYLALKKKKAAAAGIAVVILELPETATTEDVLNSLRSVLPNVDGVVVQLPLPSGIDTNKIISAIPAEKDPDGFAAEESLVLAPVPGAIAAIAHEHKVSFKDKKVVVLGYGRLVGEPVARFAEAAGANVSVMTIETGVNKEILQSADIIVTGIGSPKFVTADMVREDVVVFDAGTSEDGGDLVGDVHPDVYKKAALYTPVPGGIGPVTIAVLLRNLIFLKRR